jgi:hypothetical protein
MTRPRAALFSLAFAISFVLPARPQQAQTATQTTPAPTPKPIAVRATQANRAILVKSGTLKLLSPREADITTGDATGLPVTVAFHCNQNTKEDPASPGDAVNVVYVADGNSNLALVVRLIKPATETKGSPGEIGGVAKAEPPVPPFSLSPADAQSLQTKLEKDFGLAVADGGSEPAYGRVVVLQNHTLAASRSGVITPWNIYVNGTIETDPFTPPQTKTYSSSSFSKSITSFGAISSRPKHEEDSQYTLAPGQQLEVVKVAVDPNSVLLVLAAARPGSLSTTFSTASNSAPVGRANDLVYTTLAFPIISNDTSSAESIDRQITQLLGTNFTYTRASSAVASTAASNSSLASTAASSSPSASVATVLGIINGSVYINRGSSSGIKAVDKFQIVREVSSGLTDPATGKPSVQKKKVCVFTVVTVTETVASGTCEGESPQAKDEVVPLYP